MPTDKIVENCVIDNCNFLASEGESPRDENGLDYLDELDCMDYMDGCNVHTVQFVHIVQSINLRLPIINYVITFCKD